VFAALLREHGVQYVIDVRSQPYSRHQPQFNREVLSALLHGEGVGYVFMGDLLGGRPADPTCYVDGKVDYVACRAKPWFQSGIERLERALQGGHRLALMCSEARPEQCHRTKLIAIELVERGVTVLHIDEAGSVISHAAAMLRIDGGQMFLMPELNEHAAGSRKRYAS
jgi:uncharacterized protein (DUF488 family)